MTATRDVETIEFPHGVRIRIVHDEAAHDADPRRTCDNLGRMITFHRKYRLGDEHEYPHPGAFWADLLQHLTPGQLQPVLAKMLEDPHTAADYRRWMADVPLAERDEQTVEFIVSGGSGRATSAGGYSPGVIEMADEVLTGAGWVILPLYLFDHSGLAMNSSPDAFRAQDPGRWDWGMVGWLYASPEAIAREKLSAQQARHVLEGEVREYSRFLEGEVYGCVVQTPDEANAESCWSILGLDHAREVATGMGRHYEALYGDPDRIRGEGI